MAQSIANNREPAGAAQQLDAYLQRQMSRASGQVRLFELFSAVLLLIGGILGSLFLVALVDAWVIELRPWMRWLVLISLVGGSAAWTILVIVPLMIRRINPVYAARMVELARPEIKNGLINYLLLRSVERSGQPVSRRVIELVGSRAAHDISGVEISETIDKSRSVRAAMFLVLVLGAFATYLFLSPKSPFQTIARVLAPSADLARPARVRIFEVQPGDAVAFFGQPVTISARVSGRFAEEPVSVVYSTTDGQVINATIGMQPSESADESWSVVLRTDERGVGQSLTYHVEAGDGKSSTYSLIVKSTPMLTVDRIEYRFPEYTRLPELRETGNPEIHGLEGTTVTVHAVANTELKQARLELLNRIREGNYEVVGTVPLQVADKKNASGSFQLQLDTKRQAQLWSHYRLELTTTDGTRGDPGTPFPIKVIPDLAPEIQILEPEQPEVTLPLNSRLRFFVRAQDQDFELRRIVAYGTSLGVPAFEKEVPIPPDADRAGQINVAFDLVPKELLLRAGETVVVNFEAVDNRTALTSNAADPNRTRSNNVIVTITPPVENPEESTPPPDGNEQNDKGDSKTGENNQPPRENDKGEKKKDERGPEGDDAGSDEKNPDDSGEGDKSGEKQNDKDTNDPSSGEKDSGDSKGNKKQGRNKDDKNSSENKGDEGEGAGSDSDPAAGAGRDKSDSAKGQKSDGKQTGAGEKSDKKGDKSGSQDSQTEQSAESGSSGESDPQNQQGNSDGSPANPDDTGSQGNRPGENGNSQDQMSEDAHPGEIFEEINRFREQKQNNDRGQGQEQKGSEESGDNSKNENGKQSDEKSDPQNQGNQARKTPAGGNKGDKASPDEKSSGNPGDKSDGGDKSQGNPQASDKQGGKNQGADKQGGDKQNDQKQGDQKQGDQKQGEQKQGEGEKENSSSASQQQDGDKTNQGNPSQGEDEGNSGQNEKSSSAGGQGEEKSGDKKDGDKSSGGGEESEKGEQKDESTTKEPGQGGPPEETSGGESPGSSGDQKGDSAGGQGGEKSGDPSAGKQGNKSAGDPSGKGNGDEKTGGDPSSQKGDGKASGDTKAPANKPGNEQGSSQGERAPGEGNQGTGDDAGKQAGGGEGEGKGQKGDGQGDSGQGSKGGGGSENPDGSGSETGGGGSPSSGSGSGAAQNKKNPTGQDVGADEANLEFTKKATDLALEYLEGQQEDPDPELLERLNWTEEELREFVQRWKDLKARAESGNEADKRQLEQELRSLGLTQSETAVGEQDIDRDQQSGYREEGRVSNAPPGFKAFQRRRNRTDENKK